MLFPLVIGFFVLATYWNACSDLGTGDSYSLCNFVSQAWYFLTRSLSAEFYFLNFFNAESRGKRPLHPLVTTTPERQGQNQGCQKDLE